MEFGTDVGLITSNERHLLRVKTSFTKSHLLRELGRYLILDWFKKVEASKKVPTSWLNRLMLPSL